MPARIGSPVSGWRADLAGQREQLQRPLEVDAPSGAMPLGREERFGFSAFSRLAELDVGAEAAVAQGDSQARRRSLAEDPRAGLAAVRRGALAVASAPAAASWRV